MDEEVKVLLVDDENDFAYLYFQKTWTKNEKELHHVFKKRIRILEIGG